MIIGGVEVSVYPDLLLRDDVGSDAGTGALKFYFTKSRDLDPQAGRWMASFLYQYMLYAEEEFHARPDLCMVYDARGDQCYEAGRTHVRLFQNIESACQIIGSVWPSVTE